jgi:dynein intermediate chain 4, axonemal
MGGDGGLGHGLGSTLLGGLGAGGGSAADLNDDPEGKGKSGAKADGEPAKVKKLFSYSNEELIQGRAVTAMVWNAASSDLLAVGYGKTDIISDVYKPGEALDEEKHGGLVLFWSLRNPDYPEKILRTSQPVTALDFSKQSPMTLAVGLLNGDVNVYDVRREGANWQIPVETSAGMAGGHTDPVWCALVYLFYLFIDFFIVGVDRICYLHCPRGRCETC